MTETSYTLYTQDYNSFFIWAKGKGISVGFQTFSPLADTITLLIQFSNEEDHTAFKLRFMVK
jgi:hypothetical protein